MKCCFLFTKLVILLLLFIHSTEWIMGKLLMEIRWNVTIRAKYRLYASKIMVFEWNTLPVLLYQIYSHSWYFKVSLSDFSAMKAVGFCIQTVRQITICFQGCIHNISVRNRSFLSLGYLGSRNKGPWPKEALHISCYSLHLLHFLLALFVGTMNIVFGPKKPVMEDIFTFLCSK